MWPTVWCVLYSIIAKQYALNSAVQLNPTHTFVQHCEYVYVCMYVRTCSVSIVLCSFREILHVIAAIGCIE